MTVSTQFKPISSESRAAIVKQRRENESRTFRRTQIASNLISDSRSSQIASETVESKSSESEATVKGNRNKIDFWPVRRNHNTFVIVGFALELSWLTLFSFVVCSARHIDCKLL